MIYVDELVAWPQKSKPGGERYFGSGKQSCHMTTDGDLEELHKFAERIGLRRAWFQGGSTPHYDLTPNKRTQALAAGAVFVPAVEQARRRLGMPPVFGVDDPKTYEPTSLRGHCLTRVVEPAKVEE